MFEKILIANRGEIALRIIRSCREMGVHTVAVYSTADSNSLHVKLADEAICIGPPASKDSYNHIPSIISAAEIADVEAIHPGYGFLSENVHFAEICESCKIKFIGPSVEAITQMGDKIQAREKMKKSGIPVIPGSEGEIFGHEEAVNIAREIGYPVILKAAFGGGGRGMRVARNDVSLAKAFMTAKAEAEAAFGNGALYIEKFIEEPRHVEVQILADAHGNMIHLGERDCTVQRRHQKVLEEAPSPVVSPTMRSKMGKIALKASKAVDYVNAGTVEFLLDKNGDFYFIEMNTRVQVEHPVTEMVTGIDIIKEQLKIAAGEHLEYKQDQVKVKGWAIEARINAEDPEKNFMPSPGKIERLDLVGGRGIRVDTHLYQGYVVQPYYDSMLAKIIAYGKDRDEVIAVLERALTEISIRGINTNTLFVRKIIQDPQFKTGHYSTDFIDRMLKAESLPHG